MILALIKINPHPRTRLEILDILRSAECVVMTKNGCLESSVYLKKTFDEEVILYVEQWQSREDFERHVRSSQYDRILAAMDLSRSTPEISFQEGKELGGMKAIEAIRNQKTRNNHQH